MRTDKQFDAHTIGTEAYLYLYPLVTMEFTRRQATNPVPAHPRGGRTNTFTHARTFPDKDRRAVRRPNFDTLNSSVWVDLSDGPIVLSAPDTAGRYYLLPILDMWTDVFAVPGWRTAGTGEGHWLIAPTGWAGEVPAGVTLISAPTPVCWILGRTQTNGPDDYPAVNAVQDGYTLIPLQNWISGDAVPEYPATVDASIDMDTETVSQVNALSATDYFTVAADLLGKYPPHPTDWSQLARIERIGIVPGQPFDPAVLDHAAMQAMPTVPAAALAMMEKAGQTSGAKINGWAMNTNSIGVYGNFYAKRAATSLLRLGANPPEDAIYPLTAEPVDGTRNWVLHMEADDIPPVAAFWSLSMYDEEGYPIANPLHRFVIGDRDPLRYRSDGSLDLWVGHETPGRKRESNWLPAPSGPFSLLLRLYGPTADALGGRWRPPALQQIA